MNGTHKWLLGILATVIAGWILCGTAGGLNVWNKQGRIDTRVASAEAGIADHETRIREIERALAAVGRIEEAVGRIEVRLNED